MSDEISAVDFLELTTELTVAWLSNPETRIAADELPAVIRKIHDALTGLSSPAAAEAEQQPAEFAPAVSVRRSLSSKEHIISLIDGKPYKMLKRHLALNGLTPEQYRARYGLKSDYPMVAPAYAETRRTLAKKSGLGRKAGAAAAAPAKPASAPKGAAAPKPATKAPRKRAKPAEPAES